jgi:cytochrome c biogenesis protein CcdA
MNTHAVLGLALGAGLVAALNPCGFAFLPGCLGLVIAGSSGQDGGRRAAVARAAAATVAMAAGFVTVFGFFGLVISPLLASAQKYLPYATLVIGVLLIATGVWLLLGNDIAVMLPRSGGAPTARLSSMYGYGVGYAIASLSCTAGPFLALIGATFERGSWLTGVLAFLVYAGGMAITVGAVALAVALLGSSVAGRIRGLLPHITRIAGVIVLLTGVYVAYYGYYERQLFFSHGSPHDPIVERAASVQIWLQSHVGELGPWPFVWVIAAVVVIAVLPAGVRRLRGRHD